MKKSSIALIVGIVTLLSGFVFGQGQAYSPLGIDLSGYWVQLGRQQDAGLGTAAGDLVDFGGVPVSAAGRLSALAWSASRLLLPQHSDNRVADLAARSYVEQMDRANVKMLLYQAGLLHQKCFVVDDLLAGVGTANFDNRSFRLNFELTLLVHDQAFVAATAAMLQDDFTRATAVSAVAHRRTRWSRRLLVRLARLTAPVQ